MELAEQWPKYQIVLTRDRDSLSRRDDVRPCGRERQAQDNRPRSRTTPMAASANPEIGTDNGHRATNAIVAARRSTQRLVACVTPRLVQTAMT